MIKGINSSGRYVNVTGGMPSNMYIGSNGGSGAGMIRYNTNTNNLEVNDGSVWRELSMSYATVELNPDAESLLDWARKERDRHQERERKIKENPALQKAYEAIQRAEENFDMLEAIAGDYKPEQESK